LCNSVSEFFIPMKLVGLTEICFNVSYSIIHTGKHLSDAFPTQYGMKQGDALLPFLFILL